MNHLDKRQPDFAFPSMDPVFSKLGFLKIYDLLKLKITNCLNNQNPTNFHSWFNKLTTQTHSHNTRSKFIDIDKSTTSNNLFIPTALTTHYRLKSLKYQGPKIWNAIPPLIRTNTSP